MTTNPAFQRGGRVFSSIRSAISDNGIDDSVSLHESERDSLLLDYDLIWRYNYFPCQYNSPSCSSDVWQVKSNQTSGYRYRSGTIMSTVTTPSPDTGRYYVFEGVLAKSQSSIWRNAQFWEDIFLGGTRDWKRSLSPFSLYL